MHRDDVLVVDMVTHGFNRTEENYREEHFELAKQYSEDSYQSINKFSKQGYEFSREKFFRNHTAEMVEGVVFDESDVDLAVYQPIPHYAIYHDGISSIETGVELRDENPDRTMLYGSVNPLDEEKAIEHMENQVEELDVKGIKLYPADYHDGERLKIGLDDEALPIIERARELGVEIIAVHKFLPNRKLPKRHFGVDDVFEVAPEFPDMKFELVHAGMSFLEDTTYLLSSHPNVYANFEVTSNLAFVQPRRFANILGELLFWAGPDKLMFGSGCTWTHPQPLIEAIWNFEIPDELREQYGYPEFTDEMKRKFLGLNAIDFLDLDEQTVRRTAEANDSGTADGDELSEPWSSIPPRQTGS